MSSSSKYFSGLVYLSGTSDSVVHLSLYPVPRDFVVCKIVGYYCLLLRVKGRRVAPTVTLVSTRWFGSRGVFLIICFVMSVHFSDSPKFFFSSGVHTFRTFTRFLAQTLDKTFYFV